MKHQKHYLTLLVAVSLTAFIFLNTRQIELLEINLPYDNTVKNEPLKDAVYQLLDLMENSMDFDADTEINNTLGMENKVEIHQFN